MTDLESARMWGKTKCCVFFWGKVWLVHGSEKGEEKTNDRRYNWYMYQKIDYIIYINGN